MPRQQGGGEQGDRSRGVGEQGKAVSTGASAVTPPADKGRQTGDTFLANLVSLCRFHHRLMHEDGRVITLLPDGSVEVSAPGALSPTPFHRRE
jgi:hypothetical protein